ncbi:MAG TPA: hypothetical protein VES01_09440 [Dermatophilaceae bacterium]|nr:hypothetical protein [Dermatophilaceae bacterium]
MTQQPARPGSDGPGRAVRRPVLLRLDPAVHDALVRWAADELRSLNAQVDLLVRRSLREVGRMPGDAAPTPRRGRPPRAGRSEPPQSVD